MAKNDSDLVPIMAIPLVLSLSGVISIYLEKSDVEIEEQRFEKSYRICQIQIDTYESNDDFQLLNELYNDCKNIDKTIRTHKKLHNSIWRGKLYSEKIGNTELIYPQFERKFNNKNKE